MPRYIYPSERVLPYVYMGTHKTTGQFYIGSRTSKYQKLPSHLDLGQKYFTSSKFIKSLGFDNFDWIIVAEFFNPKDAYDFEQDLILENWSNSLKINGYCDRNKKFNTLDYIISEQTLLKMRKPRNNTDKMRGPKSLEARENMARAQTGYKQSEVHVANKIKAQTGLKRSEQTKKNISTAPRKKYNSPTKVQCPHCQKIGGSNVMHLHHFSNCKFIVH